MVCCPPSLRGEACRQIVGTTRVRVLRLLLFLFLRLVLVLHPRRRVAGDLVLLENQDRTRWDPERIDEGGVLIERALRLGRAGPYQIQAAIAALHDGATTWAATDWPQIVELYRRHLALDP